MQQLIVDYDSVRDSIPNGAVLLFRAGWKPSNLLISRGCQTSYAHAGMAHWEGGRLYLLETIQFHGGRKVPLSEQAKGWPGQWDVYEVNTPKYRPELAVQEMLKVVGKRYGWASVLMAGLRYLAVVRWFMPAYSDDDANGSLPFCSMAVSRAMRAGGVDPIRNRPDRFTTPGDLGGSAILDYRCTLK